jgi:hypothetical protein
MKIHFTTFSVGCLSFVFSSLLSSIFIINEIEDRNLAENLMEIMGVCALFYVQILQAFSANKICYLHSFGNIIHAVYKAWGPMFINIEKLGDFQPNSCICIHVHEKPQMLEAKWITFLI